MASERILTVNGLDIKIKNDSANDIVSAFWKKTTATKYGNLMSLSTDPMGEYAKFKSTGNDSGRKMQSAQEWLVEFLSKLNVAIDAKLKELSGGTTPTFTPAQYDAEIDSEIAKLLVLGNSIVKG